MIHPYEDENGYLLIDDNVLSLKTPSNTLFTVDGEIHHGKYLHRMVVFSFGDCYGKPYNPKLVIDHRDMNHKNNSVENLEQITQLRNLWRAWYITKDKRCFSRYETLYNSTKSESPLEFEEFIVERECDIKKYNSEGRF